MGDSDTLQNDLADLLRALGLQDHARPQSPHEVFRECIEKVKRLRTAEAGLRADVINVRSYNDGLVKISKELEADRDRLSADNERLRAALVAMRDRDDRNGSLPPAYRTIIDQELNIQEPGGTK